MHKILPQVFVALFPSKKVASIVAIVLTLGLAYFLWKRLSSEVRSAAAYRPNLSAFEEQQLGMPKEFYDKFTEELFNSLDGIFDWVPTKIRLLNQLNAMSDVEVAWVAHIFNVGYASESESLLSYIEAEVSISPELRMILTSRLSSIAQNTTF